MMGIAFRHPGDRNGGVLAGSGLTFEEAERLAHAVRPLWEWTDDDFAAAAAPPPRKAGAAAFAEAHEPRPQVHVTEAEASVIVEPTIPIFFEDMSVPLYAPLIARGCDPAQAPERVDGACDAVGTGALASMGELEPFKPALRPPKRRPRRWAVVFAAIATALGLGAAALVPRVAGGTDVYRYVVALPALLAPPRTPVATSAERPSGGAVAAALAPPEARVPPPAGEARAPASPVAPTPPVATAPPMALATMQGRPTIGGGELHATSSPAPSAVRASPSPARAGAGHHVSRHPSAASKAPKKRAPGGKRP